MIADLLSGEVDIVSILLSIPIILLSLSFHEFSHGYIAYKMGDPTARYMGRLTLNPLKHLDPLGTLCMFLFGFGWARPVPVNTRRFTNPKKGMALTALAGPVSNVILAFAGMLLYCILSVVCLYNPQWLYGESEFLSNFISVVLTFLAMLHSLNLSLAVFNLLPVPPLDGSRLFFVLLPDELYFKLMKYEHIIQMVIMLALFTGMLDRPLSFIVGGISSGMFNLIQGVIGLFV